MQKIYYEKEDQVIYGAHGWSKPKNLKETREIFPFPAEIQSNHVKRLGNSPFYGGFTFYTETMSYFIPEVGMITKDAYLHGCGTLDDIGSPGIIVYVAENYFILENTYTKAGITVNKDSYWVVNEGDFTK